MDKHTPTPWTLDDAGIIWGPQDHDSYPEVTTMYDSGLSDQDAAFIVRAVNAHDELLEACKEALYGLRNTNDENGRHNNRITQLTQAIAKAEGLDK